MGGGNPFVKKGAGGSQLNYFTADPKKVFNRTAGYRVFGTNPKAAFSTGGIKQKSTGKNVVVPVGGVLTPTDEEYQDYYSQEQAGQEREILKAERPERESKEAEEARRRGIIATNAKGRAGSLLGGGTYKRKTLLG